MNFDLFFKPNPINLNKYYPHLKIKTNLKIKEIKPLQLAKKKRINFL